MSLSVEGIGMARNGVIRTPMPRRGGPAKLSPASIQNLEAAQELSPNTWSCFSGRATLRDCAIVHRFIPEDDVRGL